MDSAGGAGEARCGQRGKALAQQAFRRPLAGGGVLAAVGDRVEPGEQLAVQVLEVGEDAAHEEAVLEVADRAFDLALGAGPVGPAEARREAVAAGEVEQAGVVAGAVGEALQDDHLGVVVEHLGGHAAEVGEGARVAGEEGLQVGAPDGLGVESAREAEHHDEQLRGALLLAQQVAAETAPVDLGLLAGRGLEAHHRLAAALAVGVGELLEDGEAALVAEGADLLAERGRRELGEVGEASEQVVLVGVELARQGASLADRRSLTAQGRAHGVATDRRRALIALIEKP